MVLGNRKSASGTRSGKVKGKRKGKGKRKSAPLTDFLLTRAIPPKKGCSQANKMYAKRVS